MRRRLVLVLVVGAVLAGSCTSSPSPTVDEAAPEEESTPAGGRPVGPDAMSYRELIDVAVIDIQAFWEDAYPEAYGEPFEPIPDSRLFPAGADELPPPCGDQEIAPDDVADNAFYCFPDDYVAWDDESFFPALYRDYGPFTVAVVLAHEWGHAIQGRALIDAPSIVAELQADCFAGAWTRYVADGESPALELEASALEQALAGLIAFRDEPGSDVYDDEAHGSAFDRINAFQEGFEDGVAHCATYPESPPLVLDLPFESDAEYESGGNLPLDEAIEAAAIDLNSYWSEAEEGFVEIDAVQPYDPDGEELPVCGSREYTREELAFSIFYCAADNYVGFDETLVEVVYREMGDFGVATLLATQWGLSAQMQAGLEEETGDTVLQRTCFAGSWTGDVAAGRSDFALSPGDLDEAIQAILGFAGDGGADDVGYGGAFEQVQAFRDGFFYGHDACTDYTA
jgi:predicted metalloprotease